MKLLCGRTIKGVITCVSFIGFASFIVQLLFTWKRFNDACAEGESSAECIQHKGIWMISGISVGSFLFLCFAIVVIRRGLVGRYWMYLYLKQLKSMLSLEKRQRKYNPTHHFLDDRLDCSANYLTDRGKGSKFLKKPWCCVFGAYYNIIWFDQLGG